MKTVTPFKLHVKSLYLQFIGVTPHLKRRSKSTCYFISQKTCSILVQLYLSALKGRRISIINNFYTNLRTWLTCVITDVKHLTLWSELKIFMLIEEHLAVTLRRVLQSWNIYAMFVQEVKMQVVLGVSIT